MTSLARQLHSVAGRYGWPARHGAGRAGVPIGGEPESARPAVLGSIFSVPRRSPDAAGRTVSRRSRLEAVLLVAREPVPLRKLAQLANLTDGTEARTLVGDLRRHYDVRGCAFQIEQLAGGFQLLTRPRFAPWLRTLADGREEIRLTPPALETLAVVAYRQPVLRAEVEAIRGVGCGEILRQLMDRDLLRITGRSEELGRPLLYGTTKQFLQSFGLNHLEQLPMAAQLRREKAAGDAASAAPETSAAGLTGNVDAA